MTSRQHHAKTVTQKRQRGRLADAAARARDQRHSLLRHPSLLSYASPRRSSELAESAVFIDAQLHFDGLTANLTVFDITTQTGARIHASLESSPQ